MNITVMTNHPTEHPHPIEGLDLPPAEPFPTEPLNDEPNEAFAERKRRWARDNSDRIDQMCWAAPGYLPD